MPAIYQNDEHFLLIANHIIAVIFDKSISDIIPRFTRKILNINMPRKFVAYGGALKKSGDW